MNYTIEITTRARNNIKKIYNHYATISPELGREFLERIALRYASLLSNPESYSIKQSKRYREALIKKFPYVIYFKVKGDTVVIFRVIGTRQNRLK